MGMSKMVMSPEKSLEMFGVESIDEFRKSVEDYECSLYLAITSMMSDAQEELERGMNEKARKTLNRAKFIVRHLEIKERLKLQEENKS